MKRKGLSLLEILVSTILLALVIAALANIFIATKRLVMHTRSRTGAAELAARYLEPLHMQVSQQGWATNCLGVGTDANCDNSVSNPTITETVGAPPCGNPTNVTWRDCSSLTDFVRDYDIVDMDFGPAADRHAEFLRRVSLRIKWDERKAQ